MAWHGVRLAAFLAQPHPEPAVLREHVLDLHAERGTDPREAEHHQPDQRPVAQPDRRGDLDTVDQRADYRRKTARR
jgi:hypothetical protein